MGVKGGKEEEGERRFGVESAVAATAAATIQWLQPERGKLLLRKGMEWERTDGRTVWLLLLRPFPLLFPPFLSRCLTLWWRSIGEMRRRLAIKDSRQVGKEDEIIGCKNTFKINGTNKRMPRCCVKYFW